MIVMSVMFKGGSVITSDTVTFINTGCTTCGQLDYCLSAGQNTNNEWIQSVSIDNIEVITGDNGGYWRADSTLFSLTAGFGYDFTIKKGGIDVEFVKVWIDVDQNGTFSTSELVLADFLSVIDSQLTATIQIPNHAIEGLTRMRVSMQWNSYPEACGLYQFGEVEDYCFNMIAFNSIDDVLSSSEIKLYQSNIRPYHSSINS